MSSSTSRSDFDDNTQIVLPDDAKRHALDDSGIGFEKIAAPNSSGIKVLIVGAGFAGLACAIECRRKGHEVVVLEKFGEMKILGQS